MSTNWKIGLSALAIVVLVVALMAISYAQNAPRYRDENEVVAKISRLLGAPIRCVRTESFALLPMGPIDVLFLPAGVVDDGKVDELAGYLKQLPNLDSVDIRQTNFSPEGLQRIQAALPEVTFGFVSPAEGSAEQIIEGR